MESMRLPSESETAVLYLRRLEGKEAAEQAEERGAVRFDAGLSKCITPAIS